MTTFSTVTGMVTLLALSASGDKVVFDLDSNGHYWWGAEWVHAPADGDTGSCVCIKGWTTDKSLDAVCFDGIGYDRGSGLIRGVYEIHKEIPFELDGRYPIEITTDGHDGLWFDRVRIETNAGKRWYGANNSHGWCLSKDRDDKFDKWSTYDGCCWPSLLFYATGEVYGQHLRAGFFSGIDTTAKCAAVKGRRRAEGSADVDVAVPANGGSVELDDIVSEVYFDADPTGEHPNQVHSEIDALVVGTLHQKIRELVQGNADVTDAQIDSVLNSAMLDVEHFVERQEHEGEVLEPEALGLAEGSNIRNVQERLQNLEESEGEEEPLVGDV